jgi:hypothetical protein
MWIVGRRVIICSQIAITVPSGPGGLRMTFNLLSTRDGHSTDGYYANNNF